MIKRLPMPKTLRILPVLLLVLLFSACRGGRGGRTPAAPAPKNFPMVEVPSVYSANDERLDYAATHFWDRFFLEDGVTDTALIRGVPKDQVEQALSNYILMLNSEPKARAQAQVAAFYQALEAAQRADTASTQYLQVSRMVEHYLYDPNSPFRDEDLFLPWVSGMAASEFISEDDRPGYIYQARTCAMNPYGTQAPDFVFRDLRGRNHHLYEVRAEYTLLFFSNPGCASCQEIIDEVMGRPYMEEYLRSGRVAVVNIYSDEDLETWRAYAPKYPASWYSGYDPALAIRDDRLYVVRAIPSLYLLDADKNILMKDAPTERVLAFLDTI